MLVHWYCQHNFQTFKLSRAENFKRNYLLHQPLNVIRCSKVGASGGESEFLAANNSSSKSTWKCFIDDERRGWPSINDLSGVFTVQGIIKLISSDKLGFFDRHSIVRFFKLRQTTRPNFRKPSDTLSDQTRLCLIFDYSILFNRRSPAKEWKACWSVVVCLLVWSGQIFIWSLYSWWDGSTLSQDLLRRL